MLVAAKRYWIQLALVGVAAVWGATFVMVKDAVERFPLYGFLGWRFAVATVAFAVLFPRSMRRIDRPTLGVGMLAGVFLCAGYVFQTWGLQGTTASKAAFITGMFVVITPLMQTVLLRNMPRAATLGGVALAVVGLWLLSGGDGGGWSAGDTRVLICAAAYSAHMIVLGSLGRSRDVGALTLVQLGFTALVCVSIAAAVEGLAVPSDTQVWFAILVTAVLASALAFWVQTYAQRYISPTKTALILIMEPAFGGLFGWIAGDVFGVRGVGGAALILGGMVLAEVVGTAARAEERVVLQPSLEGPAVPLVEEDDGGRG